LKYCKPRYSQCNGVFVFLDAMDQIIKKLYRHYLDSSGISTDTRKITSNCLFFALKGDNFDGNKYALQAIEKGAKLAVIDNPHLAGDERFFLVKNVLLTLQGLAQYHRSKLKIPIIGITGSNGKTTTKELMGRVLEKKYKTFYTRGNLNNHIGVPLSILSINEETEIAIIEMGANHPGEIADLCKIAKPDFGIITNIGKAHLEGFGDFQGVVKTKNELYESLKLNQGKVFVNADDPLLMELSKKLIRYTYGTNTTSGIQGSVLEKDLFLTLQLILKSGEKNVKTQLIGDYNLPNILAAARVGQYFDVDDELICRALEGFTPENMRSQYLKTNKNSLILDAYNANPTSMSLAIENFAGLNSNNKMVILGDMLELGKDSPGEHKKIIELLQKLNFGKVILVGKKFSLADTEDLFSHFIHVDKAIAHLSKEDICDHMILIKGSRGIQLEKLVKVF